MLAQGREPYVRAPPRSKSKSRHGRMRPCDPPLPTARSSRPWEVMSELPHPLDAARINHDTARSLPTQGREAVSGEDRVIELASASQAWRAAGWGAVVIIAGLIGLILLLRTRAVLRKRRPRAPRNVNAAEPPQPKQVSTLLQATGRNSFRQESARTRGGQAVMTHYPEGSQRINMRDGHDAHRDVRETYRTTFAARTPECTAPARTPFPSEFRHPLEDGQVHSAVIHSCEATGLLVKVSNIIYQAWLSEAAERPRLDTQVNVRYDEATRRLRVLTEGEA